MVMYDIASVFIYVLTQTEVMDYLVGLLLILNRGDPVRFAHALMYYSNQRNSPDSPVGRQPLRVTSFGLSQRIRSCSLDRNVFLLSEIPDDYEGHRLFILII